MRILNFQIRWPKLFKPVFTTYRYPRKDRDYEIGETLKIVYRQRSPYREELGIATVINKEKRWITATPIFPLSDISRGASEIFQKYGYKVSEDEIKNILDTLIVSNQEAIEDGFESSADMYRWMGKQYGNRVDKEPMNKLTLKKG